MRVNKIDFILFVVLYFSVTANAAKLPSTFPLCQKSDPNFQDCVRNGIEKSMQQLTNGAKEIGVVPLDPLEIPQLTIGAGSGPVNVVQHYKNVKIVGMTQNLKIQRAYVDLDNKHIISAISDNPEIRLEAEYEMKGRILLLPIVGSGPCNISLLNIKINHIITGEPYEKKGTTYWKVVNFTSELMPERVVFKFDNLFDGDKRLGSEINTVLNENSADVFADVKSGYEESLGIVFKDVASRVFNRVAMKDIFLD